MFLYCTILVCFFFFCQTDQKCHEYNKLAQRLKLIPSNAEYARGKDLEMRALFTGGEASSNNFHTSIKVHLYTWPSCLKIHARFSPSTL